MSQNYEQNCSSANDFVYSCLSVCLSVVCDTLFIQFNKFAWEAHWRSPMTHCVRWDFWPQEEKDLKARISSQNAVASSMLLAGRYKRETNSLFAKFFGLCFLLVVNEEALMPGQCSHPTSHVSRCSKDRPVNNDCCRLTDIRMMMLLCS